MKFKELKNADELRDELVTLLRTFEKESNTYHTNVYLYVEDNVGRFELFPNPGNSSWINDDHYVIYTDNPHYDDEITWYNSIADVAEALDVTVDDLRREARSYHNLSDDDEMEDNDVYDYIRNQSELTEKLQETYFKFIDELPEFEDMADQIIKDFDEMMEW